jgi:4-amino-4-deoxy-L-arabinose transferase-like glycosyltransferase
MREPRDHQLALVWIIALGAALRLMYLNQPMRYDESVTYMYFVRLPWTEALSTYTYPNNHLFHTLLAELSVAAFGPAPWALRLPALVSGILIIPATYFMTRALYGAQQALFAAAIVASSGVLILYSTNARGYGIVVLGFLLLATVAARLLNESTTRDWIVFGVIAALGLWTIPVMLYPLGAVTAWLMVSLLVDGKRRELRQLGATLAGAAVLTIALYAPVVRRDGLAAVTRNRFVTPSGWFDFFAELPRTLAEAVMSWGLGARVIGIAIVLLAAMALVRHQAISRFRVGLPLAAFVWCSWLLVVSHRAPFPRAWLWLLPLMAALASAGVWRILQRSQRGREIVQRRLGIVAVALAFALAAPVVLSFAVLLDRDTGTYRDARDAASTLTGVLRPDDAIFALIPTNGPLDYYLDRAGVPRGNLFLDVSRARRVFVIVDAGEGQTLEHLTRNTIVTDTSRFEPPQLVGRLTTSGIFMYERRDSAR